MIVSMTRRGLLGGGLAAGAVAALVSPERLFAAMVPADWTLGVADIEADIAPRAMRRVHGRAPADFGGTLFRNGPARFRRPGGSATHWFDGDGMVRRFAIDDGDARLSARFVDTFKYRHESKLGAMVQPGFGTPRRDGAVLTGPDDANSANTSVMMAGGELWALWEAGSPYRMDPETLETRGTRTFRPDLAQMPFLAHPRVEQDGTVWNLGLAGHRAIVWRLAPGGTLADAQMIELPRASYIHDFTMTARALVIVLQPWMQEANTVPVIDGMAWRPEAGTQILVIDKNDLTKRRTYELPAFSYFHMGDAWEESDGTIRFDICTTSDPTFVVDEARALLLGREVPTPLPMLTMIALKPDGRATAEATGVAAEFPQGDKRYAGKARNLTIFAGLYDRGRPMARGVGVHDRRRDATAHFDFGSQQLVEEFLFVPRGTGEGDGWLIGTTINLAERATELHLLDARDGSAGPVATWRADVALPYGFHGTFAG